MGLGGGRRGVMEVWGRVRGTFVCCSKCQLEHSPFHSLSEVKNKPPIALSNCHDTFKNRLGMFWMVVKREREKCGKKDRSRKKIE